VRWPADGGLFHVLQAFAKQYHVLPPKAYYYQRFTPPLCGGFPSVTIFYMAHDWHMKARARHDRHPIECTM
jgi:hypothetical protein